MRIVQINSVYGRGSTGRIAADIHQELRREGHESWVAYGRYSAEAEGVRRFGTNAEFLTHVAATLTLDDHGLWSKRATREMGAWLEELAPDVVHLHNLHGFYANHPLLFETLRRLDRPVVWTLHDCWTFTGHCAYFTAVGCEKWRTGCGRCPQKTAYPPSLLLDRSARNFRIKRETYGDLPGLTLVTPSAWLGDLAGESFLSSARRRVIPNDPLWSVFSPTASDWRTRHQLEDRFVVLAVANIWEERKGLAYLLELLPMLRADEKLVVVGRLPRGHRLPPEIMHVPATRDAGELAALYSAADVFVNPTLEDNYPTTNLEAAACGTVPVTFDTGGSGESALRGGGRVVAENTAAGLRRTIDALRDEGLQPLAPGTTRPARLAPDGPGMVAQYLDLYRERSGGRLSA